MITAILGILRQMSFIHFHVSVLISLFLLFLLILSIVPDARIHHPVGNVGNQIADQNGDSADEQDAHQDRIVARHRGGVTEHAHARPLEDRLDDIKRGLPDDVIQETIAI